MKVRDVSQAGIAFIIVKPRFIESCSDQTDGSCRDKFKKLRRLFANEKLHNFVVFNSSVQQCLHIVSPSSGKSIEVCGNPAQGLVGTGCRTAVQRHKSESLTPSMPIAKGSPKLEIRVWVYHGVGRGVYALIMWGSAEPPGQGSIRFVFSPPD